MIHEHDAMQLASAALDFRLTEAEAERLRRAVADCPVCAERAGAYRDQERLLSALPELEVSEATRRRIARAALTGRVVDTRTPMLLLAAALLIGLALAVAAAVGGVFESRPPVGLPRADAPGPSASPATARSSGTPAASPGRSVATGGAGGIALPADTIATVVTANLRVRSAPRVADDSIRFEPLLQPGDLLFVVQGPVVADDYEWYEVRPIGTAGSRPWTSLPSGWVARADHDGEPWVAAVPEPPCPTGAVDVALLARMHPLERVACFGDRPLSFRAVVGGGPPAGACDPPQDGSGAACVAGPAWLAGTGGWQAGASTQLATGSSTSGPRLAIHPSGAVSAGQLPAGRAVELEGAFDHPAAADCRPGQASGAAVLSAEEAVLRCRAVFVVSGAVPGASFLTPGRAAVTVTSDLRVRSLPVVSDASRRLEPLLRDGTRLFVLDGPTIGSGYDWYEVVVPQVAAGEGLLAGWVAVASKDGEPWARNAELACPPAGRPVTLADLARLAAPPVVDGGLSCLGSTNVRFEADAELRCAWTGATRPMSPDWLSSASRGNLVLSDGGLHLAAKPHPALRGLGPCDMAAAAPYSVAGRFVLEGHFDDEAAATCSTALDWGPNPEYVDARATAYWCRVTFVVTSARPAAG